DAGRRAGHFSLPRDAGPAHSGRGPQGARAEPAILSRARFFSPPRAGYPGPGPVIHSPRRLSRPWGAQSPVARRHPGVLDQEGTMDLDATGWPRLPTVGSRIEFHGGDIVLQALGVCTIVRADHVRNAAGKPGGRVTIRTERGELVEVTLSQVRSHAD